MLTLVPCPLCGEASRFVPVRNPHRDELIDGYRTLYGDATKSEWKTCGACGFVHQNPRPSTEALNAFYAAGEYHGGIAPPLGWSDAGAYMKFARWYYGDKVDYAIAQSGLSGGRVFEVGFGYGGALKLFAEKGWQVEGREPDPRLAGFARDTLELTGPASGLVDDKLTGVAPVDLIFSNHAFEHIADLHGVMRALRKIVKPGAHIFTAVPTYAANRSSLSLRWMNSGHYSMFTHASLDQLMARHGFEPVRNTYRGWRKEIDDVWHVARYTGAEIDPRRYYEDPQAVARFINWVNPLRSALFYPVFSNYSRKVQRVMYVKEVLGIVGSKLRQRLRAR